MKLIGNLPRHGTPFVKYIERTTASMPKKIILYKSYTLCDVKQHTTTSEIVENDVIFEEGLLLTECLRRCSLSCCLVLQVKEHSGHG